MKCVGCGKGFIGRKRKYCSRKCLAKYTMRMWREKNLIKNSKQKLYCVFCGNLLSGRQKTFCSKKCYSTYWNRKTKPLKIYSKAYCMDCGIELVPPKTKFCSRKCNSKYFTKINSITPEKRREYNQNWKKNNPEKYLEYMNKGAIKYKKAHPEKRKEFNNKYFQKHPDRQKTRKLANKNISVEGKMCELCGSIINLHRHHEDYNKPLEVQILCEHCHLKMHGQRIQAQTSAQIC
jgi:hypothetical protein